MLSISLSAKDLQKSIGYDKIELNQSAEELQKIFMNLMEAIRPNALECAFEIHIERFRHFI